MQAYPSCPGKETVKRVAITASISVLNSVQVGRNGNEHKLYPKVLFLNKWRKKINSTSPEKWPIKLQVYVYYTVSQKNVPPLAC